ncbi:hypothetical protein ACN469_33800 [Corallococcus terminator]
MGGGVERVDVSEDRKGWGVEVVTSEGEVRRYRYRSEAQARFFAAVFEMGPRVLPPVRRVKARKAA